MTDRNVVVRTQPYLRDKRHWNDDGKYSTARSHPSCAIVRSHATIRKYHFVENIPMILS